MFTVTVFQIFCMFGNSHDKNWVREEICGGKKKREISMADQSPYPHPKEVLFINNKNDSTIIMAMIFGGVSPPVLCHFKSRILEGSYTKDHAHFRNSKARTDRETCWGSYG